jgi:hypothetical protein
MENIDKVDSDKIVFKSSDGKSVTSTSIWKNWWISFKEHYNPKLANWPEWLVERVVCIIPPSIVADLVDMALDMPRSIFSNVFSRKLQNEVM